MMKVVKQKFDWLTTVHNHFLFFFTYEGLPLVYFGDFWNLLNFGGIG